MKLIDKEACMSEVFSFNKPLFTGENKAEMSLLKQIITDINNQPTVEAIPIDFLIKIHKEYCKRYGGVYRAVVLNLVEDWRRENELVN